MAKHTSGPWTIQGQESMGEIVVDREGFQVADCGNAALGDAQFANARLIASAPRLREVCEVVANRLETLGDELDDTSAIRYTRQELQSLAYQLTELLTKAIA